MIGWVILAFLAAFGLFCAVWAAAGIFLPPCREGWLLCPGRGDVPSFAYLYLWLRGMGLLSCPLAVLDLGLSEEARQFLEEKGIEIRRPESLSGQEMGAESI